jgi:hypothetical protein
MVASHIGGKLLLFQSSVPSLGVGKVKPRDNPQLYGGEREASLRQPDDPFFKRYAAECSRVQVCLVFVWVTTRVLPGGRRALKRVAGEEKPHTPHHSESRAGVLDGGPARRGGAGWRACTRCTALAAWGWRMGWALCGSAQSSCCTRRRLRRVRVCVCFPADLGRRVRHEHAVLGSGLAGSRAAVHVRRGAAPALSRHCHCPHASRRAPPSVPPSPLPSSSLSHKSALCPPFRPQLYYYPGFMAARDGPKLAAEVKHNLLRPTAWEAVMRVRCSKGLRIRWAGAQGNRLGPRPMAVRECQTSSCSSPRTTPRPAPPPQLLPRPLLP